MSEENVDFVRNLFEAADGMDKQALLDILPEAVAQAFTDDAVWEEDPGRADRQVWRGHDGICASWRRWVGQWGGVSFGNGEGRGHRGRGFLGGRWEAPRPAGGGQLFTAEPTGR